MSEPIKLAHLDELSHEEWLLLRREGIGSSDAPVILGLSPWSSPWQIWLDKTGQIPPDTDQTEAMYFGSLLEDTIAKAVAERTGMHVEKANATYAHPEHPWMLASPDCIIHFDGEDGLLEIKNSGGYKMEEWKSGEPDVDGVWRGGEAPSHYILQVQHQHAVMGTNIGYIGALLGGNRLCVVEVPRDDDLIATMIKVEGAFWRDNVQANVAPAIDGSPTTTDLLSQIFSDSDPYATADLEPDVAAALVEYQRAGQDEAAAKERKTHAGNIIRNALGEAETAMFNGVNVATWKPQVTERFDQKAFKEDQPEMYAKYLNKAASRVLRIGRSKEAKQTLARIEEEI